MYDYMTNSLDSGIQHLEINKPNWLITSKLSLPYAMNCDLRYTMSRCDNEISFNEGTSTKFNPEENYNMPGPLIGRRGESSDDSRTN